MPMTRSAPWSSPVRAAATARAPISPAGVVGATMTLPMDVRLAAEDARIGFVFARRGIIPEACSSWFLPRVVGISRAMEWVATGRVFPAQEALEAGLVRSLHPGAELLGAAREPAVEGVPAFLEKRPAEFPDRVSEGLPDLMPGWSAPEFR